MGYTRLTVPSAACPPMFCALTGSSFQAAFAVVARVRTASAGNGYAAEAKRRLRFGHGTEPQIPKRGPPYGSGPGKRRWPVGRANTLRLRLRRDAGLLDNKRLGLRCNRHGRALQQGGAAGLCHALFPCCAFDGARNSLVSFSTAASTMAPRVTTPIQP